MAAGSIVNQKIKKGQDRNGPALDRVKGNPLWQKTFLIDTRDWKTAALFIEAASRTTLPA